MSERTLRSFPIEVPGEQLGELRQRLERSRWPSGATHASQGIERSALEPLVTRWRDEYDWRVCEAALNQHDSQLFRAGDVEVHLLHARSARPEAIPLVLTHGWPGSVVEFLDVIEPLTTPPPGEPAFHVVVPSLPGFGFSSKPSQPGWGVERIAEAWDGLMRALGYGRYLAQGGDWGAMVSTALLRRFPASCRGVHLNLVLAEPPRRVVESPDAEEADTLRALKAHRSAGAAYAALQATKPQSLAYALADSPLGLAGFVLDKFEAWSQGEGFGRISPDRLLDNLTLWWLTDTAGSAARLYWESYARADLDVVHGPVGCTIFPGEISRPSRRWAEARFPDLCYFERAEAGGHFAAMEEPASFVRELRAFSKQVEQHIHG